VEPFEDPRIEKATHNQLFDLLDTYCIDGLITLSSGLAAYIGVDRFKAKLDKFRGIPRCSLGVVVDGIPSVVSDSRAGMTALVEHVVVHHGRRRPAFLGSLWENAEIEERQETFINVCERFGIAPVPERFAVAGLEAVTAQAATTKLIEEAPDIDAIIAANDGSAIGVIRALDVKGIRVPEQIIVTGYDDIPSAQLLNCPLTTVRQPLEELAETAIDVIARQIAGHPVPLCQRLPTRLVLRESCGCGFVSVPDEFISEPAANTVPSVPLLDAKNKAELQEHFHTWLGSIPPTVDLDEAVRTLCRKNLSAEGQEFWSNNEPRPQLTSKAKAHERMLQRLDLENMYVQILEMAGRFSRSLDMTDLELNLSTYLPMIHPRDLFMCLFLDATGTHLRRALRIQDGAVSDTTGELLPTSGSVLTELCGAEMARTVVVLALTMQEKLLGIIGFHSLDTYLDYLLLRDHVASALQVVRLHDEVLRQTMVSERNAQERQAAADRTRTLSALAAGVAHDLNNALGSLVALSDVVSDEVRAHLNQGSAISSDIVNDLSTMKSGALRAAETIKDLMTLGRIGRPRQEPFEVTRLTQRLVDELRITAQSRLGRKVDVACTVPQKDLIVVGSETHIERAIGNLLRNAIDAVADGGSIEVNVAEVKLGQTMIGYESIPAGSYTAISVQDQGLGIEPEQLRQVFEPFFSTKRLGENSGSGLGLAIVHSVIKEHHGYVDVASAPGQGSRFTVYLPHANHVVLPRQSSIPLAHGSARILVVDDDLTQLRTAKRVLTKMGYDVITTASGNHAF
jgi:signal transduction histidine kinase/DNA-binding LacI/PurR family transcriptional regulator